MELLQLTYFCDAAETENFSRTALKYSVPPSDISQRIKRLEAELGVKLFDRRANRIVLNDRGHAFYQKAKQALTLLQDARAEATDSEATGTVRLSVRTNRRVVMQTVRAFRQTHPMVDVVASHNDHADIQDFHLIVAGETLADAGLQRRQLLAEDVCLALARNHPLAGSGDFAALATEPFISMGPGSSIHALTVEVCARWGFTPHIAIQSDDPFYIRKCVELGLGVSVVPTVSWKGQFSENIFLQKIDHPPRNTYVYWDGSKYLPASARAFLDMLTEAFRAEEAPP